MGWVFRGLVFGVVPTHMVNDAVETMALTTLRFEFV